MNNGSAVAKTVWTEADFDAMDWHDNAIHAIAVEPVPDNPGRLLVDLDYIVEWVSPTSPPTTLDFWICPATLVFDPAWDLTTDVDMRGWAFQLFLNEITRSDPTNAVTISGPCPVTASRSKSAHPASRSTCAARRSSATAPGSRSRNGEDSPSPVPRTGLSCRAGWMP
jgi:hypothetical protein